MTFISLRHFFPLVFLSLLGFSGVAAAQGYTPPMLPAKPLTPSSPLLPDIAPVAAPVTPAPSSAPVPVVETPASAAVKDPCEAYIPSPEAYAVCQDQIKKIQRMIDARTQRENDAKPPPPPQAQPKPDASVAQQAVKDMPVVAPSDATGKAAAPPVIDAGAAKAK